MSSDPTTPQSRVIVLCFDGTAGQYGPTNTNVVKFYALLDKCCPLEQIVYYQPGIGTFFNPGIVSPTLTWLAKMVDLGVAWYLNAHVMGGYKFLMENYRAGDKICIFGFSRGAYTARALAGFLFKIGLLPRDNDEQVPFAYDLYKRTDDEGLKLAVGFKRTFCTPVTIDFLGVWDTVASVGLIYGRDLPFTSANSAVRIFRHALSLDEHRARFQPNMFHRESPQDSAKRKKDPYVPVNSEANPEPVEEHRIPSNSKALRANGPTPGPSSTVLASSDPVPPVWEVWFAGCHSDVGGGEVADAVPHSLADISLRWMVKQVVLSQCGIRFSDEALSRADIDILTIVLATPTEPIVELAVEAGPTLETPLTSPSSPGKGGSGENMIQKGTDQDVEEQNRSREQDVRADIHDQLKMFPIWWLLEFLPTKFTWQEPDGTWKSKWGTNLGRGRQIIDPHPDFHESVRQRMAVAELRYKPRAKWTPNTEQYVD